MVDWQSSPPFKAQACKIWTSESLSVTNTRGFFFIPLSLRQDGRLWAKYIPIHQVYKLQGRVMAEHRINCRRCDKDWKLYFRKLQNRFTYRFVIGRRKGLIYSIHPSESSTTMKDLWVRGILLLSAILQPVPVQGLRNINLIKYLRYEK